MLYSSYTGSVKDYHYTKNHFINAILYAYNNHISLKLDPGDINIILSLNVADYITNNAEQLRSKFVDHEGQKELEVLINTETLEKIDYENFITRINEMISENVKLDLTNVLKPEYTTTTDVYVTTVGAIMMSAYKEYFCYTGSTLCGIKSVILNGTLEDWEKLNTKYVMLKTVFPELSAWYEKFDIVMDNLMVTKRYMCSEKKEDEEEDEEYKKIQNIWGTVIDEEYQGSGANHITGWCQYFQNRDAGKDYKGNPKNYTEPNDFLTTVCSCKIKINGAVDEQKSVYIKLFSGVLGIVTEEEVVSPLVGYYLTS